MSLTHSPSIVRSGLVLHLDAANVKSYPGTGTTWKDLSGYGNNATLTGNPTYSAANNGSIVFNGGNDAVLVGNLGSLYTAGTISLWMYSTAVENYRNVFSTNYHRQNDAIRFEQYTTLVPYGAFNVVISNNVLAHMYSPAAVLTVNSWYHVVFVWNKSTNNATGYLNGIQQFNEANTVWPNSMPDVAIGAGFGADRHFKGNISNTQLYNRALSAEEVTQNFEALRGRYGI